METRDNIKSYKNTVIEVTKIRNYIKLYKIVQRKQDKRLFVCVAGNNDMKIFAYPRWEHFFTHFQGSLAAKLLISSEEDKTDTGCGEYGASVLRV